MPAFSIDISNPLPQGADGQFYGGPNTGGHHGPDWFEQFGMDLGAPDGTEVRAAFDGHITKVDTTHADTRTTPVYGAGIFMRSPNDGMGCYYTHLSDVPSEVAPGASITRGQLLGYIIDPGGASHLHMALVEIVGGQYIGVDLYDTLFVPTVNTDTVTSVTFAQDGSTPPG